MRKDNYSKLAVVLGLILYSTVSAANPIVTGQIKEGLPEVMSVRARSEVTFAYSNTGDVPVTGVTIQKTYPKDFRETYTNCPKEGESLAAKASCEIKGILTPRATGKEAVSVSFFAGGVSEVPLKTSTTVGKSLLVAVGEEGMLLVSQNGKRWEWAKDRGFSGMVYTSVTWSPKLQQFLVTGINGSILTSHDGNYWKPRNSNTAVRLNNATWSEDLGEYLVVGEGGLVLTSYDGIEWDSAITNTTDYLTAAVWSREQKQYVVVGLNGRILTSRDGYDWVIQASGVSYPLRGIAWDPITKQYAVSTQSDYVLLSSDGIHWESIKVKPGNWRGITWGNRFMNTFAMVGEKSKIAVSQDGRQWVVGGPDPWGPNPMLYGISWDDGLRLFTAVGANGHLFTSPNGTSWSDTPEEVPCSFCLGLQGVGSGTVLSATE